MNRNHPIALKRRPGFTLIEILVVIAIIAILASLILGAVMLVRNKGPEAQNRNDLLQLSNGLQKFKTKFGFYPPSQIRLRANVADYRIMRVDVLDDTSIAVIASMWPNLTGPTPWAGATPMPSGGFVLDGDQCLVFFLGGIPNGAGGAPLGFSLDPSNPADVTGDRLKFFDFDGGRIQLAHGANNPFPSFLDAYYRTAPAPQPFIYFSSNKRANGYDPTPNTFGVSPYVEKLNPTKQFYLPSQFQIISAGLDGQFGPGGIALPAAGAGKDDMSNFTGNMLGVAP